MTDRPVVYPLTLDDSGTTEEGWYRMPSGYTLFWKRNEAGGRTYLSDEVGGGVFTWDTALVGRDTLAFAMAVEDGLNKAEHIAAERAKK